MKTKKTKIINYLTITLILISFISCGSGNNGDYFGDKYKLKSVTVKDPNIGIDLLSIDLPRNWMVSAETNWNAQQAFVTYDLIAMSSDSTESYRVCPSINITQYQDLPILTLDLFMSEMILPGYKGYNDFKILAKGSLPFNPVEDENSKYFDSHNEVDSIVVSYTKNGKEYIDVICAMLSTKKPNQYLIQSFGGYGPSMTIYGIYILGSTKQTNSAEEALSLFNYIATSMKINPQWSQYSSQFMAENRARSNQASQQQTQAYIESNNRAYEAQQARIRDMEASNASRLQSFSSASESSSRVINGWTDVLTQRQNVVDPYTGDRMKVSNQYNSTWINNQGQYMQTNSSGDPNQNANMNTGGRKWTRVDPVR